ncbi:MAG TPA: carbohydrate kinase family protein [Anaerolineales bacterium]|nr:carbohydrate kinase family protein [Anaerolineales bacterium]
MIPESTNDDPILVIGSASLDIIGRVSGPIEYATSNPGILRTSVGGSARNIAENLARLGMRAVLVSAVGDDPEGERVLGETSAAGVDVDHCLRLEGHRTGAYLAVLDDQGTLHLGLDDMPTVASITPNHLRSCGHLFKQAAALVIDANLPPKTLASAISLARRNRVPVVADTTSVSLARRLQPHLKDLWIITPNEAEAEALCPRPVPHADPSRAIDAARYLVSQGVGIAVISMAEFGVSYATADSNGHISALQTEIVDPTGAGDALTATLLFALLNEIPLDEAVRLGISAAAHTLRSRGSVASDLSLELLYNELR